MSSHCAVAHLRAGRRPAAVNKVTTGFERGAAGPLAAPVRHCDGRRGRASGSCVADGQLPSGAPAWLGGIRHSHALPETRGVLLIKIVVMLVPLIKLHGLLLVLDQHQQHPAHSAAAVLDDATSLGAIR